MRVRGRKLIGRISAMASGKVAAQTVTLSLTPFIAWLFDPAHFGAAAVVVAIVEVLGWLAGFRFQQAIPLPAEDLVARHLSKLALWLVFGFSLFLLVLAGLGYGGGLIPTDGWVTSWLWLVPFLVLLVGVAQVLESWLVRAKNFGVIAVSDFIRASSNGGGRICLGLMFGSSTGALLAGFALASLARNALLVTVAFRTGLFAREEKIYPAYRPLIREYQDFPLFNLPAGLLRQLSQRIPVLVLGALFTPAVAGHYAMAERLVRQPVNVAVGSLRKVYLQWAAELRNEGLGLYPAFIKATAAIAGLGILPLLLFLLFVEDLAVWLLGVKWQVAADYAQFLAFWLFSVLVAMPATANMVVLRLQAVWLRIQLGASALRIITLFLAYALSGEVLGVLAAFVTVNVAINVMVIVFAGKITARLGKTRAAFAEGG